MRPRSLLLFALAPLLAVSLLGCPGSKKGGDGDGTGTGGGTPEAKEFEFPPLQPFKAEEWDTTEGYPAIGSPNAKRTVKDPLRITWRAFPPTLRTDGPSSNLIQTRAIHGLVYESLISIHPETEEFIPFLATHWKIETDEAKGVQTFWFRLDEKARFSDGSEVTAKDVYESWWHKVQEDRNDPSNLMTFRDDFEEPVIVDKYTIKVTTKELNWRLFLYFGGIYVMPAKEIHIPGKQYLEDYNWKLVKGSGPYELRDPEKDVKKGDSVLIRRRDDWWAENEPWAKNTYNFAQVKFSVVTDPELNFEMFKKNEVDHFRVSRAQRWVEELPKEDVVKKGWVKQRKIINQAPQGFTGFALNMREWPFDDKRVRLAFAHLFNLEELMERMFFNEYEYVNSIFPGRDWGNMDNPRIEYDPDKASELLAEAGYTKRDDEGILVHEKTGKRLELTFEFGYQSFERIWLVVKEFYEENGIRLNLNLINPATLIKKVGQRQFKLHYQSWGALLFPNPETSWRSDLADKLENNNLPGFKNDRVDELCKEYNLTLDRKRQKEITREIDRLVCAEVPYAFGWYANFLRVLYWDKFGHPESYFTRIGDDTDEQILLLWWFDEDKMKRLDEAREKGETLEQGQVKHTPWKKG